MSEMLFVIGADDLEMQAIERLLSECRVQFLHALGPDGNRVHPGNAYEATIPPHATHVVECGPAPAGAVVIDHHRPGDPGYGKPPAGFLAASSIGQVLAALAAQRGLTEGQARAHGWKQVRRAERPEYGAGWNAGALAVGGDLEHGTKEYTRIGAWVGWFEPPTDIVLCAAADHCLDAALRGECPGVDPAALRDPRCSLAAVV